jgi:hypothetical protein
MVDEIPRRCPLTRTMIVLAVGDSAADAASRRPRRPRRADKGKPGSPGESASAPGQAAEKNAAKKCKAERT